MQKDGEKTRMALYGRAGRSLFTTFGDTPARGGIAVGERLFVVHRGTLWEVNNAGTQTNRGTISTTTGRVDMATDGDVILITTGTNGYTFNLNTNTLTLIADPDFPQAAKTCSWLDGNFIVDQGDGDQFQISPDGIAWDALDAPRPRARRTAWCGSSPTTARSCCRARRRPSSGGTPAPRTFRSRRCAARRSSTASPRAGRSRSTTARSPGSSRTAWARCR
jgi:hypothetical protein